MNALLCRYNGRDGVSNHQPHDCLLDRSFGRRSKKTWKLRVTGLCAGNSPVTGEFPAQMASNAENVSIWWRHHAVYTKAFYPMVSPVGILPQSCDYCDTEYFKLIHSNYMQAIFARDFNRMDKAIGQRKSGKLLGMFGNITIKIVG